METPEPPTSTTDTPTDPVAALSLDKQVSRVEDVNGNGVVDAGDRITYVFVVTNTGTVVLTDVSVDDPKLEALGITVRCDPTTLRPGASVTCEADSPYSITQADTTAGRVVNTASAVGDAPAGVVPPTPATDTVSTTIGSPVPLPVRPGLPVTGAHGVGLGLTALALLGVGGAMIVVRRRSEVTISRG
ncbi:hypothetical protein C8046_06160 [Serinibacter arcticus]|uniref:DUF7507 domain-containing protein n=1 Tax=Serinibacter arcticus TaxID=1655435 RepID=A0A2U1ZZR1_9MICO|nr:hypothetical protein C8046_06160 [Serinibacter arcticus]